MSKPNWSDAPEWANYLAMDESGVWCWYEFEPYQNKFERWEASVGKVECADVLFNDWADSLEPRPE